MSHSVTGENRDNLVRTFTVSGRQLGTDDWGDVWVQDGKVWLVDATKAELWGDYFEFLDEVRAGKRPTFQPLTQRSE